MSKGELTLEMMRAFNDLEIEVVESRATIVRLTARAEAAERERDELRARVEDLDAQLCAAYVDDSDDDGGWTGG